MANYCPECGSRLTPSEVDSEEAQAAETLVEDLTSAEVRIAEINADKEIRLAKIAAGVAESETQQELAHSEGKVEGMETVIEAASPEPDPELSPEPAPVVVADVQAETEPEMEPPDSDDDGHDSGKPKRKSIGLGMW